MKGEIYCLLNICILNQGAPEPLFKLSAPRFNSVKANGATVSLHRVKPVWLMVANGARLAMLRDDRSRKQ